MKAISIIIPSYNGRLWLKANFPLLLNALEGEALLKEWIIVDDGSSDSTDIWIREHYPDVKLLKHKENRGFISSINDGIQAAANEIVVLMNNDITIKRIPVTSFLEHFNDPSLFAVTMQSLNPKTKEFREGAKGCRFVAGFIKILHAKRHTPLKQDYGIPSLYPVGGHCVLRRSMFLDLGGLDPLFSPFYWEDTDLGYRAWKKGWKTVYAPDVEVFHDEQGTILGSHKKAFIQTVRYRNRLLFIWKNMDDKGLLAVHLCFLFLRMLFSWAWCDFKFYRYLTGALLKLPAALRARRRRIKRGEKADDKWLIRTFK